MAKKVPRISAVEKPREDVLTTPNVTEDPQKKTITQSVDELKNLKLVTSFNSLTNSQDINLVFPKNDKMPFGVKSFWNL